MRDKKVSLQLVFLETLVRSSSLSNLVREERIFWHSSPDTCPRNGDGSFLPGFRRLRSSSTLNLLSPRRAYRRTGWSKDNFDLWCWR